MSGLALDGENPVPSVWRIEHGSGVPFFEEGIIHSRTERARALPGRTLRARWISGVQGLPSWSV